MVFPCFESWPPADKDSVLVRCGRKSMDFSLYGLLENVEVRGGVMVRSMFSSEEDAMKRIAERINTERSKQVEEEAMAV